MTMPGFNANASLYARSALYRPELTRFGIERKGSQVYMQKPNSDNTPGGSCYGFQSGTIITGAYDKNGRCCETTGVGFLKCIDCDVDKCYDKAPIISGGLWFGNFQGGVFARL
jgi:hypothetical protein